MSRRWPAVAIIAAVAASVLFGGSAASADAVRNDQYWLDSYGIRAAWATTQGAGVTIAIIDTGVSGSVAELAGAVIGGADFSGLGSSNGQMPVGTDGPEHGTMVASLAAGRGTSALDGVIGSAPAASILSISIGFGEGATTSDDQIAAAVRFAVDNGADVINMSLTRNTLDWPESWDSAFLYAMNHDVVIVAAAGNRGSGTTEVGAPATMPGVLTVGGVDMNGLASFDASSQGITIAVSAPSEQLVGVIPGGQHVKWSGTSGATPIVAGIVALVRAAYPGLDANNVINRIVQTAKDAGVSGADAIYGYGLIDAKAAVTASVPRVSENPMGSLAEWITIHRRAPSAAVPTPTLQPSAPTTSTPTPDTPVIAGPQNPLGTILPTVSLLRNVGIPLAVVLFFLGTFVAVIVLGAQRVRRSHDTE
ncbi:S8 family serine peptidase [Salinibacterium sp. G-O1]|uniref:S8 family serine peptidase n=1 Tax=Salinibacterium sp. G-O1 TaxID=3046208 RepID=UPI0024BBD368|nr:S8 family serine peptidase [Salinibacterium sp. G-O1]MDJ0334382.1 S8 family serine peptidase [Salinibacterium sp. G-O1]